MKFKFTPPFILDFDIENRPLTYLGNDYTTCDVTAVAYSWGLDKPVRCLLLGQMDLEEILDEFVIAYDNADIVTGHFIRHHDLPIINGALLECSMPPLGVKLTWDTKLDLKPIRDFSVSQESLGQTLCTNFEKIHMSQPDWRKANRLEAIELTERRVVNDVRQHQELRIKLSSLGMLESPKAWSADT